MERFSVFNEGAVNARHRMTFDVVLATSFAVGLTLVEAQMASAGQLAGHTSDVRAPQEMIYQRKVLTPLGIGAPMAFRDCAECPTMVVIPAGHFEMGSDDGEKFIRPSHTVSFARPFAIGMTEVTQGQWKAFMGSNPSCFRRRLFSAPCGGNCPVEAVSWNDVQEFIGKLNTKTGKHYRLPTEAEWDYACRAGGHQTYCGSDNADEVGWFQNNSGGTTHPVASKLPNAFGLYDMSGNVSEWVQDCWHADYAGAPADGSAWTSETCTHRVIRGGSWDEDQRDAYAANRDKLGAGLRFNNFGFRLARALEDEHAALSPVIPDSGVAAVRARKPNGR
jgi:formylglycine-generating enzyme required for sulfatase activity